MTMTALTSTPFYRRSLRSRRTFPGITFPRLPRTPISERNAQRYLGSICGLSGLSFADALDQAVPAQQPATPPELASTLSKEQH